MSLARYVISTEHSTALVAARSSVGPIVFEARELTGQVEVDVVEGKVVLDRGPSAYLEVDLESLRSGNDLYDAEMRRRIDTRRFPRCLIELARTDPLGDNRFTLVGNLTFHGTAREIRGTVEVEVANGNRLVITGERTIDIRDFDLPAPSILMLKIYPEVQVKLFLEARVQTSPEGDA